MAKRTGQRKRKQQRRAQQRIKHPTQLGTTPPIKVDDVPNEWPLVILSLLIVGNVLAWQEQFVLWFG